MVPQPLPPGCDPVSEGHRGQLHGQHGEPYPDIIDLTEELGQRITAIATSVPNHDKILNDTFVLAAAREGNARQRVVDANRLIQSRHGEQMQRQAVVDCLRGGQDPSSWLNAPVPEIEAPAPSGPVRHAEPVRPQILRTHLLNWMAYPLPQTVVWQKRSLLLN